MFDQFLISLAENFFRYSLIQICLNNYIVQSFCFALIFELVCIYSGKKYKKAVSS